jgi:hypothetical protein
MSKQHPDVPADIVESVRSVCVGLPEVREERAWTGTRWVTGKQTFAHAVQISDGWPPVYCRAAGTDGPATVLTFQSSGDELLALSNVGHPFFRPTWRPGIVAMFVDDTTDWDEVRELLTESFCLLAAKRLVEQVNR